MHWELRPDQCSIILIISNKSIYWVAQKDVTLVFDNLLNAIDCCGTATTNEYECKIHEQYSENIITVRITNVNPAYKHLERDESEYIELDDYIHIVASIFDVLNAHHYRKL